MSSLTPPFQLSPYFHPTTVCVVDDNEAFLRSLVLEMPATLACHGFTRPEAALAFLNAPIDLPPLVDRCFTLDRSDDTRAVIHLDLGLIEQEINYLERFRRISVVLVDYAMPSVNGLQLCARMHDPYVRKAMLTGVADEKVAVEAFNAGLIHRFIPKHTATAVEAVLGFVRDLQRAYFSQYIGRLRSTLAIDPPGFLVDPEIAWRVERLMKDEALVEYYLVNDPPGLLMLRSNGSVVRLVLLDQTAQQRQIDFVRRYQAPPEIRAGIESGALVGLFSSETPDDYFGSEPYPWDDNVVAAERISSRGVWLMGLVRNAATDIDFDPAVASYDAYLATLDAPR